MLRFIPTLFCLLWLPSLTVAAETNTNQVKGVNAVVQAFIQAYEKRDLAKLMQYYDPNAVVIGTGKDEVMHGREQIQSAFKRELDQHTDATINLVPIAVAVENNIAFATYSLVVDVKLPNKKSFQSPLRLSLGLVKHGNTWLIMQSHLSAPLAGQAEGQSFPST